MLNIYSIIKVRTDWSATRSILGVIFLYIIKLSGILLNLFDLGKILTRSMRTGKSFLLTDDRANDCKTKKKKKKTRLAGQKAKKV